MGSPRKKSFDELKRFFAKTAMELLERNGKVDDLSPFNRNALDDDEIEAINNVNRAFADTADMLAKLRPKVVKGLKGLSESSNEHEAIFERSSVLTLWRWVEENFPESPALFDAVEEQNDGRCELDEWFKDILTEIG